MATSDRSTSYRASTASGVAASIPSTLKVSTANDAQTVPWTTARRSSSAPACPLAARCPTSPPAKESPAPVGSCTFSSGYAGDQNSVGGGLCPPPTPRCSLMNNIAPCSPRFTTSAVGPSSRISRAARMMLKVCANWRASHDVGDRGPLVVEPEVHGVHRDELRRTDLLEDVELDRRMDVREEDERDVAHPIGDARVPVLEHAEVRVERFGRAHVVVVTARPVERAPR